MDTSVRRSRWALLTGSKLLAATVTVAAGQALYFVYIVRAGYNINRPAGWDATSFWVTFTANAILGLMPLLVSFMIAYFNKASRDGQIAAVVGGSLCWLIVAWAVLLTFFGMAPAALWPYPTLALLLYGAALLTNRDIWTKPRGSETE